MPIHSSAIVSAQARISSTAEIGAFCVIEGEVQIGERTVVESHVRIGNRAGRVQIGADNLIQGGAVLGGPPQDLSYDGSETALIVGDRNRIGEHASISLGTPKGGGATRIGDDNFIMAYVHLGHDCRLEHHVVITNGTQLAGHVSVEHHAILSGLAGVTQFVRIGAYVFLAAGSFANKDIVPYTIAAGHWAVPRVINKVGLRRNDFDADTRKEIEVAFRVFLDRRLTIADVILRIESECADSPALRYFVEFLRGSARGVARA
jgi:UDP-N-acetylglucosamine acyltransferase